MCLIGRELPCLHTVQAFDDEAKFFRAAERRGLEGNVSRRQAEPSRDWEGEEGGAPRMLGYRQWRQLH